MVGGGGGRDSGGGRTAAEPLVYFKVARPPTISSYKGPPCLEGRGAEPGPDVSSLSPSMEGSATRGQGEGRKSGRGTDSFAGNPSSSARVCLLEPLPAGALAAADVSGHAEGWTAGFLEEPP